VQGHWAVRLVGGNWHWLPILLGPCQRNQEVHRSGVVGVAILLADGWADQQGIKNRFSVLDCCGHLPGKYNADRGRPTLVQDTSCDGTRNALMTPILEDAVSLPDDDRCRGPSGQRFHA
jgi:hypothetical protein